MKGAIHTDSGRWISAERASAQVLADKMGLRDFECYECGAKVQLCSFKPTNIRLPYFSAAHAGDTHATNCPVQHKQEPGKRRPGGGRPVTSADPQPVTSVIEELVLSDSTDKRYSTASHLAPDTGPTSPKRYGDSKSEASQRSQRIRARNLRSVVQQYAENHGLSEHRLRIPGVSEKTYAGCFQSLNSPRDQRTGSYGEATLEGCFVYFGTLKFMKNPLENGAQYGFEFIQEAKGGTNFSLQIDTDGWAEKDTRRILDEMERARAITETSWRKSLAAGNSREGRSEHLAFIFFLADLQKGTSEFRVSDPRLVCAISTDDYPGIRNIPSKGAGRVSYRKSDPSHRRQTVELPQNLSEKQVAPVQEISETNTPAKDLTASVETKSALGKDRAETPVLGSPQKSDSGLKAQVVNFFKSLWRR